MKDNQICTHCGTTILGDHGMVTSNDSLICKGDECRLAPNDSRRYIEAIMLITSKMEGMRGQS